MNLWWLEQTQQDLPAGNEWLTPSEMDFLDHLRITKRHDDWRLGRWTAKRALASCLSSLDLPLALRKFEIRPAASGAPEVFLENKPAHAAISLSHRNGRAFCTVAPRAIDLGCDLEVIEPRSAAFIADYFTAEEQALISRESRTDQQLLVALLWSAKESALKALRAGLRLDTRDVRVELLTSSTQSYRWAPLRVRCKDGQVWYGWWQVANDMIRTVVTSSSLSSRVPLKISVHLPATIAHKSHDLARTGWDKSESLHDSAVHGTSRAAVAAGPS